MIVGNCKVIHATTMQQARITICGRDTEFYRYTIQEDFIQHEQAYPKCKRCLFLLRKREQQRKDGQG